MASFAEEAGVNWTSEQFKAMFENEKVVRSPQEAIVTMVAKAISTGSKAVKEPGQRDKAFFAGRVSGYVNSAAVLAEQQYGCDYDSTRKLVADAVRLLRESLTREEIREMDKENITVLALQIVEAALHEA